MAHLKPTMTEQNAPVLESVTGRAVKGLACSRRRAVSVPESVALIADEDEFFRMALSTILTNKLGFKRVIEAACLDEALEQLSGAAGISIALFDLSMPGLKTPGHLRTVRECFPSTRVAIVSGSKSRQDILLALEAGVHGYLTKSLGVAELTAALRKVLEGTIYIPASLADLSSAGEEGGFVLHRAVSLRTEPVGALTPRQRDVLALLVQGRSNKEIAGSLKLGEGTVKIHVAALFRSLGVSSRAAAAAAGVRLSPVTGSNAAMTIWAPQMCGSDQYGNSTSPSSSQAAHSPPRLRPVFERPSRAYERERASS